MANSYSGNTFYVDSAGTLSGANGPVANVTVRSIVMAANEGAAVLQLQDAATNAVKFYLFLPSGSDPFIMRFNDYPAVFTGGVKVATATNVAATLTFDYTQG